MLDELLRGEDPQTILRSDRLMGELKRALAERILNTEMDGHLDEGQRSVGNCRNGYGSKRMHDEVQTLELSVPLEHKEELR